MAALCISGALRTTPNEALNAILSLPSLDLAGIESHSTAGYRVMEIPILQLENRFRRKRIYENLLILIC